MIFYYTPQEDSTNHTAIGRETKLLCILVTVWWSPRLETRRLACNKETPKATKNIPNRNLYELVTQLAPVEATHASHQWPTNRRTKWQPRIRRRAHRPSRFAVVSSPYTTLRRYPISHSTTEYLHRILLPAPNAQNPFPNQTMEATFLTWGSSIGTERERHGDGSLRQRSTPPTIH